MKNTRWTTGTLVSGLALLGIATVGAPMASAGSRDWSDGSRTSLSVGIHIGGVTIFWQSGHDGDGYYDRDGRRYRHDADGRWYRYDGDSWFRYDDRGHRWDRDNGESRQWDRDGRDSNRYDSGRYDSGRGDNRRSDEARGNRDRKTHESDTGNHGRGGNRDNGRGHDNHRR